MKVDQLIATARETMSVRRVYGEPFEKDGVTLIATARVSGGAGGGGGQAPEGQVRWMPAVDVNRLMSMLGAVLIVFFFTRVRIVRLRTRAARAER